MAQTRAASHTVFTSLCDKLVCGALTALIVMTPLFFLGITYQGLVYEKHIFFVIFVVIALLGWGTKSIIKGTFEYRATPLDRIFLIFSALILVSLVFTTDKYHAFFGIFMQPASGILVIVSMIAFFFLCVTFMRAEWIEQLVKAHIGVAAILAAWFISALYEWVPQVVHEIVPVNTIGSVSSFALYMTLSLPLAVGLFAYYGERRTATIQSRALLTAVGVAVLLITFVLFTLFVYVQWLILITGLLLFVIFAFHSSSVVSRRSTILPIIIILLIIGVLFFGKNLRLTNASLPIESALTYGQSWSVARDALRAHPIVGTGIGTFGANFSLYRPDELRQNYPPNLRFITPTGAFFGALATVGIVGGAAVMSVLLLSAYYILQPFLRQLKKVRALTAALGATSMMYLFALTFVRIDGTILIIGGMLMSLFFASVQYDIFGKGGGMKVIKISPPKQFVLASTFASALLGLGLLVLVMIMVKHLFADHHLLRAVQAYTKGDTAAIVASSDTALDYNDDEGRYYTALAEIFLQQANREAVKPIEQRDSAAVEQLVEDAIAASERATVLMPNDAFAFELNGFIYEHSGGFMEDGLDRARAAYSRAKELEPVNVSYDVALTRLHLGTLNVLQDAAISAEAKDEILMQARALIVAAIETKENYAPAYDALSQIDEARGDLDKAIFSGAKALQYDPQNFSYNFRLAQILQQSGKPNNLAIAERILTRILGINDNNINTRLSLALLYERANRKDLAQEEYQRTYDRIDDKESDAAKIVQRLKDNVVSGGSNIIVTPHNSDTEDTPEDETHSISASLLTDVTIAILDGGSADGDIGRLSADLRQAGLRQPVIGQARTKNYEDITIYYGVAGDEQSQDVTLALGKKYGTIQRIQDDSVVQGRDVDVVVVVGAITTQDENVLPDGQSDDSEEGNSE